MISRNCFQNNAAGAALQPGRRSRRAALPCGRSPLSDLQHRTAEHRESLIQEALASAVPK